jgi:hypothetical protein
MEASVHAVESNQHDEMDIVFKVRIQYPAPHCVARHGSPACTHALPQLPNPPPVCETGYHPSAFSSIHGSGGENERGSEAGERAGAVRVPCMRW